MDGRPNAVYSPPHLYFVGDPLGRIEPYQIGDITGGISRHYHKTASGPSPTAPMRSHPHLYLHQYGRLVGHGFTHGIDACAVDIAVRIKLKKIAVGMDVEVAFYYGGLTLTARLGGILCRTKIWNP